MSNKNKKTEKEQEKLTIYEYEQKYVKRENVRGAKLLIKLIAAAIGVFLFFCMFSITMRVFEINLYARPPCARFFTYSCLSFRWSR